MKQIDKYVNSVYKHVGGNKEEIESLKYEMKNHLLLLIEELKAEGKSEEESISIAINRFGEENQIENELIGIFKFVNKKAKKALIIALSFLLLTVLSFSVYVFGDKFFMRQELARNTEIFNIMSSYSHDNIDSINKDISTIVNKSKRKILFVELYRVPNGEDVWHRDLKDLEYAYPKNIQFKSIGFNAKQITSEKRIKYNVMIGRTNNGNTPMYITNIGRSSLVWLCCFIISVIAWVLLKTDVRTKGRH